MTEKISKELFDHLVELAALELNGEEGEYLRRELNNQLKAIDELAAIPIPENTKAASHGVPFASDIRPGLRRDETIQFAETEAILKQVPETSGGYIVTPEIPHEELD
jgi:aspartyl/glutamyl-tRNA(Asn/Gln) amidotransferase C subunit